MMQNGVYRKKIDREITRSTLILDEISIICAFFSAILIRYQAIVNWVDRKAGIYVSMIITSLLFAVIVFYVFDIRGFNVVQMDPIENFLAVCKNRFFLSLLTVMYFFVTQRSVLASRIVMGVFLILSAVYGYIFRMIYRKYYIDHRGIPGNIRTYLIRLPARDISKTIAEFREGDYECAVVIPNHGDDEETKSIIKILENHGIRAFLALDSMNYKVRSGMIADFDYYSTIPAYVRNERFILFGVRFCIAKTEEAVYHVIQHLKQLKGKYICFSNVHTSVMARENRDYAQVLNGAALIFPDGEPIANLERKRGYKGASRVAGPDFMEHMFRDTMDGSVSHFFYGSTKETLEGLRRRLEEKYPGIDIRGMYSPPFRPLTPEEDDEDVRQINESGADLVWIGLGAPKQEKWMREHEGRINGVMLGVGAGFDFHAGTIKRAPDWMQKIGLEWLYRLFKDPKRLFRRYIVTNAKFLLYLIFRNSN